MNAGAPTCASCGGLNTNPQATQCRFCGQALPMQQQYAPPPMQQGYGAPPMQQMQPGYGPPPGYGPAPYGQPAPPPYGAPNPYAQQYPVQGFGGVQPFHHGVNRGWGGGSSGWSTFFWIRLGIAAIAIGISLLGACVSAISH